MNDLERQKERELDQRLQRRVTESRLARIWVAMLKARLDSVEHEPNWIEARIAPPRREESLQ